MKLESMCAGTSAKTFGVAAFTWIAAWLAPGCAHEVESDGRLACGPGTMQEGTYCVADDGMGDGGSGSTGLGGGTSGGGSGSTGSASTGSGSTGSGGDSGCAGSPSSGARASMIPISGRLREIVIDPCNTHIYVSNESMNQIEDYSIAAGALEAPIPVGSQPRGFDVTPDSGRLYVANMGGSNISVVDLATRRELRKINVPPGFSSDRPFSLAIASDGKALFSTTFAGSGFGGRMMSLDLDTDAVAMQTDFFAGGTTTEATYLKASMDRAAIAVVAGDISSAPVFLYRASTSAFSGEHDLNGFVSTVAVSSNGALVMVDGTYVLDGGLNLLGTIPGGGWAAFGPTGAVAYRASTGAIEILDTSRFRVLGTVPVADAMQGSIEGSSVGNMAVSSDGKWLAVITDHGIAVVDLP